MAVHTDGNNYSREAAANLSAKQYFVLKSDSAGKAVLAAAATDAITGVLANAPTSGETADIVGINGSGTYKVKLGGTVTKDAYLTSDSAGKAVATTTTGNRVFGRALVAGVANDVIEYQKLNERHQ